MREPTPHVVTITTLILAVLAVHAARAAPAAANSTASPTVVIGLGSGRCGTLSLSRFLDQQHSSSVSHEGGDNLQCAGLEWWSHLSAADRHRKAAAHLDRVRKRCPSCDLVGDVALWNLPYAEAFLAVDPAAKLVVLQRRREDTIRSLVSWVRGFPWLSRRDLALTKRFDNNLRYMHCFPKLSFPVVNATTPTVAQGAAKYYDTYYARVDALATTYPNRVLWLDTYRDLNAASSLRGLLTFLKLSPPFNLTAVGLAHATDAAAVRAAVKATPGADRLPREVARGAMRRRLKTSSSSSGPSPAPTPPAPTPPPGAVATLVEARTMCQATSGATVKPTQTLAVTDDANGGVFTFAGAGCTIDGSLMSSSSSSGLIAMGTATVDSSAYEHKTLIASNLTFFHGHRSIAGCGGSMQNSCGIHGGGALEMTADGVGASISSCTFFSNKATGNDMVSFHGGAISVRHVAAAATISSTVFRSNVAERGAWGGTLYVYTSQTPVIGDSTFINAASQSGGAVFTYLSAVNFLTCAFVENTATGSNPANNGGAVVAKPLTNGPIVFSDCIFHSNFAEDLGGAIYLDGVMYPDGSGSFTDGGGLRLVSCEFSSNYAIAGSAVYTFHAAQLYFGGLNVVNVADGGADPHVRLYAFASPLAKTTRPLVADITSCPPHPATDGAISGRYATTAGQAPLLDEYPDVFYGCPLSCEPGRWATPSSNGTDGALQCADCPAGYFSSAPRSAQCFACMAGRYQNITKSVSIAECKACSEAKPNASMNYYCFEGQRRACALGSSCSGGFETPCQPGMFQDSEGASICKACPDGAIVDGASNRTQCESCPAGTITEAGAQCTQCPTGTTVIDGDGQNCQPCAVCQPGKKQTSACSSLNNTACAACGAGKFQDEAGIASCKDCVACSAGSIRVGCGGTSGGYCVSCDVGTFKDSVNQTCATCPAGYVQPSSGKQVCVSCRTCTAGTFHTSGNCTTTFDDTVCGSCDAGKYASGSTCVACSTCSSGRFVDVACTPTQNRVCQNCPGGYVQPSADQLVCNSCAEGTYEADINETCATCPAGYVQPSSGKQLCMPCPGGSVQPGTGNTSCTTCSSGRFQVNQTCATCPTGYLQPSSGKQVCAPCRTCTAGTFHTSGNCTATSDDTVCGSCESGKYANVGSGACEPCSSCGPGKYIDSACTTTQDQACQSCPGGYVQPSTDQIVCDGCPAGKFEHGGNCKDCPRGWSQAQTGSVSCTDCRIKNQVQSEVGKVTCSSCTGEQRQPDEKNIVCECKNTWYDMPRSLSSTTSAANDTDGDCTACPVGALCCERMFGPGVLRLKSGFWRSPTFAERVYACPVANACLGLAADTCDDVVLDNTTTMTSVSNASLRVCAQGHTGIACQLCVPFFKPDASGMCNDCGGIEVADASVVAAQLALSWAVVFVVSIAAFLRGQKAPSEKGVQNPTKPSSSLLSQEMTAIISFCQVAASFGYTFSGSSNGSSGSATGSEQGMVLPPAALAICQWLSAASVDFLSLLPAIASPCTISASFQANMVVRVLILPTLTSAVVAAHAIATRVCRATRGPLARAWARSKAIKVVNMVVFCLWPSVGATLVRAFICIDVGEMTLVAGDMSMHCSMNDARYASMVALSVVGLMAITLGIPVAYYVLLHRRDLEATHTKLSFGMLYEKYERKYFYWELIVMLYKFCMASVVLVLSRLPAVQLIVAFSVAMGYTFVVAKLQPYAADKVDQLDQLTMVCTVAVLVLGFINTHAFPADEVDARSEEKDMVEGLCVTFLVLACLGCLGFLGHAVWSSGPASKKRRRVQIRPAASTEPVLPGGNGMKPRGEEAKEEVMQTGVTALQASDLSALSRDELENRVATQQMRIAALMRQNLDRSAQRQQDEEEARQIIQRHGKEVKASEALLAAEKSRQRSMLQTRKLKKKASLAAKQALALLTSNDGSMLDTDGDGEVSVQEQLEGLKHLMAQVDDGDGELTAAELSTMMVGRLGLGRDEAARVVEMLDQDGDGTMDAEELLALLTKTKRGKTSAGSTSTSTSTSTSMPTWLSHVPALASALNLDASDNKRVLLRIFLQDLDKREASRQPHEPEVKIRREGVGELLRILMHGRGISETRVDMLMETLDADKDGGVDVRELAKLVDDTAVAVLLMEEDNTQ